VRNICARDAQSECSADSGPANVNSVLEYFPETLLGRNEFWNHVLDATADKGGLAAWGLRRASEAETAMEMLN